MVETRLQFSHDLAALEAEALGGLDLVADALDRTLVALETHDLDLAAAVVADDDRIDGRYLEVHQGILSLIARQAPVASDLRLVAALLHVTGHIERMGDQCVNIAKLISLAGDSPAHDAGILARTLEMGRLAGELVSRSKEAFARRDVGLAEALVASDDELDRLNRESFPLALELAADAAALEWAMRMVQVSRWLERIGDHAVDIGEQTAFVATGLFREFTDASHAVP